MKIIELEERIKYLQNKIEYLEKQNELLKANLSLTEHKSDIINKKLTKNTLFNIICDWESNAGEDFMDYYMHDNIKNASWAFWLLGKGYIEHANIIVKLILDGERCIDQETLYYVYPIDYKYTNEINEENYNKNIMLWSEFLVSTDFYTDSFLEFIKEYGYGIKIEDYVGTFN